MINVVQPALEDTTVFSDYKPGGSSPSRCGSYPEKSRLSKHGEYIRTECGRTDHQGLLEGVNRHLSDKPTICPSGPNVKRGTCAIRLWLVLASISSLVSRA